MSGFGQFKVPLRGKFWSRPERSLVNAIRKLLQNFYPLIGGFPVKWRSGSAKSLTGQVYLFGHGIDGNQKIDART